MNEHIAAQSLDDESLEAVSAGTFLGLENQADAGTVEYVFQVGDIVDVKSVFSTARCRITQLGTNCTVVNDSNGVPQQTFVDIYYCEKVDSSLLFINGWKERDQIVSASIK